MRGTMIDVERILLGLERRWGLVPLALMVGVGTVLLAIMQVGLNWVPQHHGAEYAELSDHVFDGSYGSRFRFRVLGPLIGWCTGLTGDRFLWVPWLFLILFLSAVYHELRKIGAGSPLALLGSGAMAFSCTTTLALIAPGYTDVITYFFVLLAFTRVEHLVVSSACFALGFWNHESVIFMLPGLLLHRSVRFPGLRRSASHLCMILLFTVPYMAYRAWAGSMDEQALGIGYYLSLYNIYTSLQEIKILAPLGVFIAFNLFWVFPFWAVGRAWSNNSTGKIAFHSTVLIGVMAQLIIAVDTTRLMCLAFPMILIALVDLAGPEGGTKIARIGWVVFLLNFIVPTYMVTSNTLIPIRSATNIVWHYVLG